MAAKHRANVREILSKSDPGSYLLNGTAIETRIVFEKKVELPHFATFALLREENGRRVIREISEECIAVAKAEKAVRGCFLYTHTYK